ncbi:MAG: hypothetical protein MJ239_02255 [Bacilli bacterium]|nr:hypothetical protein [Bacilli bacterium]
MRKRKTISSPKDFTVAELPQTRKDQFFNIFKNQYMTLLKSGFILLLFFLPILVLDIFRNLFDAGFYSQFVDGALTENEYNFSIFVDFMIQSGAEFLLLPLLAVPLSGLNNVFKTMVEGDCVLFGPDFKEGVKGSYKITLVILLVFGIFFLLLRFLVNYFIGVYFIVIPVYSFFILFIIPLTIICLLFSTYYQGNYFNVLSNSTKLYSPYWWKYLLASVLLFGFVFGVNFGFDGNMLPYFKTILLGAVIIFVLPIGMLLLHSISISLFDKYINGEFYPDNQYKGLYNPKIQKKEKDIK